MTCPLPDSCRHKFLDGMLKLRKASLIQGGMILLLSTMALAGCLSTHALPYQTYPGKRLPADQEAHVSTYVAYPEMSFLAAPHGQEGVFIHCVDGHMGSDGLYASGFDNPNEVVVLPGYHHFYVFYVTPPMRTTWIDLWLDAAAGGDYFINREVIQDGLSIVGVKVWIQDKTTGAPVGGYDTSPPKSSSDCRRMR